MSVSKETVLQSLGYFKTLQDAANTEKFVAKETGKGLSHNDFTDALKTKLDGIATGAQVNVIESIDVDGVPATVTNKNVTIELGAFAKKTDLAEYAKSADLTSALIYKGTVANFADLPSDSDVKVGYVYNITNAGGVDSKGVKVKAGDNVACYFENNQIRWDVLGGTTDLSEYVTSDALTTRLGDYVTANGLTQTLGNYYTKTQADSSFLTKTDAASAYVAQVTGKGLSANDFTTELKTKLEALIAADDEQITNAEIAALFT